MKMMFGFRALAPASAAAVLDADIVKMVRTAANTFGLGRNIRCAFLRVTNRQSSGMMLSVLGGLGGQIDTVSENKLGFASVGICLRDAHRIFRYSMTALRSCSVRSSPKV